MCTVLTDFKTFTEEVDAIKKNQRTELGAGYYREKGLCIASDSLWEEAKSRGGIAVNIAYTNYGGTFSEKCLIGYLSENYPNDIISEYTSYDGQNAFVFGDIANKIWDAAMGKIDWYEVEGFWDYLENEEQKLIKQETDEIFNEYEADDTLVNMNEEERETFRDTIREYLYIYGTPCTFGLDYYSGDLHSYLEGNLPSEISAKVKLDD